MNINSLLRPSDEFITQYNKYINRGKQYLLSKKIAFLGLARNVEKTLPEAVQKLTKLGQTAKAYKIIIFENDSTDETKKLITSLSRTNNNIIGLLSDLNRPQFGPVQDIDRTTALAEYRNHLKDYVKNHLLDYDFIIVTDLDFVDFSVDGCYNSFGWMSSRYDVIDAIAGNSYEYKHCVSSDYKSLWNYDSWAFRYTWWNQLPMLDSTKYSSMLWFGFFIMPIGSPIIPVNSAFGGMTIYKTEQFVQGLYEGYDCEHVCFHYNLKKTLPSFQLVVNPSQVMVF